MGQVSCPRCTGQEVLPIVYGLPSEEMLRKAERGVVALGGCTIDRDSPFSVCTRCDHHWSDIRRPPRWRRYLSALRTRMPPIRRSGNRAKGRPGPGP